MKRLTLIFLLSNVLPLTAKAAITDLKVAPEYTIEVFATGIEEARSLAIGKQGTVFVGTKNSEVFALKDGKKYIIAKNLNTPTGVVFRDGHLYVAEISQILKFENVELNLNAPPIAQVMYDKLPKETHHGMKFMRFGPDGMLYIPVGAPCNLCDKETEEPRFATILRFKNEKIATVKATGKAPPDKKSVDILPAKTLWTDPEIFSKGIRNTVGFDWHPKTKELWFTENGRDNMGDDLPGDELNIAGKAGMHFGFPFCHQGNVLDKQFGEKKRCEDYTAPVSILPAHVAALGMRFINETTVIIAYHGSWNRSTKIGYQLVRATLKGNTVEKIEPLVSGFVKENNQVIGRPVDLELMPDKSILFTDDDEGVIYRLVAKASK